jgi:replicative DNA helicase
MSHLKLVPTDADIDLEKTILGTAVVHPDVLDVVDLTQEDFFKPQHRDLWDVLRHLREQGAPTDPVAIAHQLERRGKLAAFGGMTAINGLIDFSVPAASVDHYSAQVAEAALTRRLRAALSNALQLEGSDLLAKVQEIAGAAHSRRKTNGLPIGAWAEQVYRETAEALEAKEAGQAGLCGSGLSTGLVGLDGLLGGIKPGVLTVVAGRPSHGKSALMAGVADAVTASGAGGVHVFSMEDTGRAYARRLMAKRARINLNKFSTLDFERGDMRRLSATVEDLAARNRWFVDDLPGLSSQEVSMLVRVKKRELGTVLVIVDYVGIMREPGTHSEMEKITQATRNLVTLARRENIAVVMLSQLSRKCEERPRNERRPVLSDLRQSGDIEQEAEAVMFVYRDVLYEDEPRKQLEMEHAAEIIVRKNKNGVTGTAHLHWDGPTTSFSDMRAEDMR